MKEQVKKLIDNFAYFVIKQNECLNKGDWKQGNKYAKKYIKSFDEIRKIGDSVKEKMKKLLVHENDGIKVTAASFLLRYCTYEAMNVLKEISKKPGIIGFEAQEFIKRWEEGSWSLNTD